MCLKWHIGDEIMFLERKYEFKGGDQLNNSKHANQKEIENIVKLAIDRFDPYLLEPGELAPENEYDGESRRIAEKLHFGISEGQIAEVIAEEFTRSFNTTFTNEDCSSPALEISKHLNK